MTVDLDALRYSVPEPDEAAARTARERADAVAGPGALGRLGDLGAWLAGAQGRCPPRPFQRVRLVVVGEGGEPGVVPADPGVTVRAVAAPAGPLDDEESVRAAVAAGAALADDEVDAGADLLVPLAANTDAVAAAAVVAALTDTEPVVVVRRGAPGEDARWMREVTAVRDALRRVRREGVRTDDALGVLRLAGDPSLAVLTGLLAQSAYRRTPVLLDGAATSAAALAADALAVNAVRWWLAAHRSADPAARIGAERLRLDPVLDLALALGDGTGALAALPLLRTAIDLVGGTPA